MFKSDQCYHLGRCCQRWRLVQQEPIPTTKLSTVHTFKPVLQTNTSPSRPKFLETKSHLYQKWWSCSRYLEFGQRYQTWWKLPIYVSFVLVKHPYQVFQDSFLQIIHILIWTHLEKSSNRVNFKIIELYQYFFAVMKQKTALLPNKLVLSSK